MTYVTLGCYVRLGRPGILDAVHALRPARSEVVVKLGLTQLRGRDTYALCGRCLTRSRVGTHRYGAQYSRDALFKGRNIQELSVRDTAVRDTSTLHRCRESLFDDSPYHT